MQIQDGSGKGFYAKVDSDNRLKVQATMQTLGSHVSDEEGEFYVWHVDDAATTAADYELYVQNNSDSHGLHIRSVRTGQTQADVIWKLHKVTGTAGGTTKAGTNMNFMSGNVADATCYGGGDGGVTGLSIDKTITTWMGGPVYTNVLLPINEVLVLGKNDAIAIEFDAGTDSTVSVSIAGFFHKIE